MKIVQETGTCQYVNHSGDHMNMTIPSAPTMSAKAIRLRKTNVHTKFIAPGPRYS